MNNPNIIFTDDKSYRIELFRDSLIKFNKEIHKCIIDIYDNILNRQLLHLVLSPQDIRNLLDYIAAYMTFGGFDTNFYFRSLNGINYNLYKIVFIRDPVNDIDFISINEVNINNSVERIRLKFTDEENTVFGLYDLFMNLYETFVYDIYSMDEICSDFSADEPWVGGDFY